MILKLLSQGGLALAKNALRYSTAKATVERVIRVGGGSLPGEDYPQPEIPGQDDLSVGLPMFGPQTWGLAAAELEAVAALRPDLKDPYMHWQLALHPGDRELSDRELTELVLDGMRELGYGDCPICISRHRDEPHPHAHIVVTRVTYDGQRVDRTKEMQRAMAWARKVEIREGLHRVQGKGQAVLPPLGREHERPTIQQPGAVEIGRQAISRVMVEGIRIGELVTGLQKLGHNVRPVMTKDGTRIKTLSIQVEGKGQFMPLSNFGDLSIQKLTKKHGLAPVDAHDVQGLRGVGHVDTPALTPSRMGQEPPSLVSAPPKTLLPEPALLTPPPVESLIPKATTSLIPTKTKQEIPYVAINRQAKPATWLDRARQWWSDFWRGPAAPAPRPQQPKPAPGRIRIG